MVDAIIRDRLEILKDTYDLISHNNFIRAGDRLTVGLRHIQSQLPWEQGPSGSSLTLDESVVVGSITIPAGLYGPQSLIREIAGAGPVVNSLSLRAVLDTPMPGAVEVAQATISPAVQPPPMASVAQRPVDFMEVLIRQNPCSLHNVAGGEQVYTPPLGFPSPARPLADQPMANAAMAASASVH